VVFDHDIARGIHVSGVVNKDDHHLALHHLWIAFEKPHQWRSAARTTSHPKAFSTSTKYEKFTSADGPSKDKVTALSFKVGLAPALE
jgi:hypothetical protein